MWNRNRIATWSLLGAIALIGVAILVALTLSDRKHGATTTSRPEVEPYAQRDAFSDPLLAVAQSSTSITSDDWGWLYDDATSTCTGQQTLAEQQSSETFALRGGSDLAIGTVGNVSLALPAESTAYASTVMTMAWVQGNGVQGEVITVPYLPIEGRTDGKATDLNLSGGLYIQAPADWEYPYLEIDAKIEIAPITANDCYGLVSARWTTPFAAALSPVVNTVAAATPLPPTSTPEPTATLFPTPGPSPTPTRILLRPQLDGQPSHVLNPVEQTDVRTGYVVAEMYQDALSGAYGADGRLQNYWSCNAITKACEVDLAVASQQGIDIRERATPWPTWTPLPTTTPVIVAAVLPAQFPAGATHGTPPLLKDRIIIGTPTQKPTNTPAPAPHSIPANVRVTAAPNNNYGAAVASQYVRKGDGPTPVTITVDYDFSAQNGGNGFAFGAGQASSNRLAKTVWVGGETGNQYATGGETCDGTVEYVVSGDIASTQPPIPDAYADWASAPFSEATATFTVTACPNSSEYYAGKLIPIHAELFRWWNNANWVRTINASATSPAKTYIQILEYDSPGPNTNAGDNNNTGGGQPTPAPTLRVQPPQPTPPLAQGTVWRGWEGRALSIILDGTATLNVPEGANVYAWAEVLVKPEPTPDNPTPPTFTLARLPVPYANGALHLASASGRVVLPTHALEIDTAYRELRLHIRVAPVEDSEALALRWERQAAAIVSALTMQPFVDWQLAPPTPTPAPPTPTPANTPVPPPDFRYYALLLDNNEGVPGNSNETEGDVIRAKVLNCDTRAYCWPSEESGIKIPAASADSDWPIPTPDPTPTLPPGGTREPRTTPFYYLVFVGPWETVQSVRQAHNPFELKDAFDPPLQLHPDWDLYYILTTRDWTASQDAVSGIWTVK